MKNKKLLFLMLMLATLCAHAQKYTYAIGDRVETEEGVYIVTGENLISNPSFDNGSTGWYAADGNAVSDSYWDVPSTGGADGGAWLKVLGGAGSSSPYSLRTAWSITPGKTYLFSCWQYRTTNTNNNSQYSFISLGNNATAGDNYQSLNYTLGQWVSTEIVFDSQSCTYCVANFRWLDNGIGFDCFTLAEVTLSDEIVTARLETALGQAIQALAETEEGHAKGQYTAEVRADLQAVIDEAQALLATPTSQADVNAMVGRLTDAVTLYYARRNPPFSLDKQYNIVHSSGYYLSSGGSGGTVKIVSEDAADATQVFTFCPSPAGADASGYNLKDGQGNFIYRSGSWDTKASPSQDLTAANAIFQIVENEGFIQLKNMGSGSVLGTDASSEGSTVYSNKNGTDTRYRWTIVEFVPQDQRDAQYVTQQLLGKARKQLDGISESLIGTRPFMYNRAACDAYAAAIASASQLTDYKAATALLEEAMAVFDASCINQPDPTKAYVITQSMGMAMGWSAAQSLVTILTPDYSTAQQFYILPASTAGAFCLKNVQSGKYASKSGSSAWDTTWEETGESTTAQWIVSVYDEQYYTLQNVSGKGYMGSDAVESGSPLYCDKSSSAVNSHWTISECSVSGVMSEVIAKAEALAASTPVGTDYTTVPQSAMDALRAAIDAAMGAQQTATTVEEAQKAAADLQAAIDRFNGSFNPLPVFDAAAGYKIVHSSGHLLTYTTSGGATITAYDEAAGVTEAQTLQLVSTGAKDTYYIRSASTGKYLAATGDYNTQWQEDNTSGATFIIEHISGPYLGLHNTSKAYFGTDSSTSGSVVYSDKSSSSTLSYWTIETVVTWNYTAFNEALAAATTFCEGMKAGWQAGEYFPDVIQAFQSDISRISQEAQSADSQESVDQCSASIQALVNSYKAKANTKSRADEWLVMLVADCKLEAANAAIGIDEGQYTQSAVDAFLAAISQAEGSTSDFESAIAELETAHATFRNSAATVDRSALAAALDAAEKTLSEAVEGDCDGQYPVSAIDAYYAVYESCGKVRYDASSTQAEVDAATAQLKAAASAFAATKVVINYSNLNSVLKQAKQMLADNEKYNGDTAGCYPAEAFKKLQDAIDEASTYVRSYKVNQKQVDNACNALKQAIEAFLSQRIPFDTSELESLLQTAKSLLAETRSYMADDDIEELEYAIGVAEVTLANIVDQADIDRALKILRRDYQLYERIATAITCLKEGKPTDVQFYSIDGRLAGKATHGLFILQMTQDGKTITRKIFIR